MKSLPFKNPCMRGLLALTLAMLIALTNVSEASAKPFWKKKGFWTGAGLVFVTIVTLGNSPTHVSTPHGQMYCPEGVKNPDKCRVLP